MADTKTRRTWISIVVAILIIIVMGGIVLIGSAAYYIRRHITTQFVEDKVAATEFESARARFAGQQPLIELRGEHDAVVHRRTASSSTELQTLRVLAFDAREGKLVRVSVPFWLLRLMPAKRLGLGHEQGIDFDTERVHLTVEDLERAGPGLVLEGTDPRGGGRVLVWTE
jgi:hypothetical protein